MMPGMNPAQMKRMMKQLGMKSVELEVKRVVFELENGKLILENPQVTSIEVQGQKTYTVLGAEKMETCIPEEDVKMVADQTGKSEEESKKR